MGDEAFALSPISARASLPSEEDYEAIPSSASSRLAADIYRIGMLGSSVAGTAPTGPLHDALLGRLRELGYAEGRNLIIERRFTEGRNERYHALATELVNLKVDLIVAPGTAAALAAKEVTSTIPIVTVVVGDPVGSQLIARLDRPGGNVTGTSSSRPTARNGHADALRNVRYRSNSGKHLLALELSWLWPRADSGFCKLSIPGTRPNMMSQCLCALI
jgi:hypothetical protein